MIHKKLIVKWLNNFIEVMCDLSCDENFRFDVNSGKGLLLFPIDIFDTLLRRGIIESTPQTKVFRVAMFKYAGANGDTILEVRPDGSLTKGLRLSTLNNDADAKGN